MPKSQKRIKQVIIIAVILIILFPWLLVGGYMLLLSAKEKHLDMLWDINRRQIEIIVHLRQERDQYAELARISWQVEALSGELKRREGDGKE